MASKAMQIFGKSFLLLIVILIGWVGINQIESPPIAEVTALTTTEISDFSRKKPEWNNELFQFIENFDPQKTPVDAAEIKKYNELLIANKSYPTIPPLFAVTSFFNRRLALNQERIKSFDGLTPKDQLEYLKASLMLSKNILSQKIYFILFSMEISVVGSTAKYLDENKARYQALSDPSWKNHYPEIKKILSEIADQRMTLINNALEGERLVQLAMSKDFKLSDMALADGKNKFSFSVWDQIGFLFYNEGATQNTIYENFENLKEAAKCVQDFSCEKLCETEACPSVPRKITGNLFLNPMGMYFTKFMGLEPRLLVKISSRFQDIKTTGDNLEHLGTTGATQ